jgi:hypothetical protein
MSGLIPKDPRMLAYLEEVRKRNRLRMSKCYICGAEAKWIIAKKHEIHPVCKEHADNE